MAKAPLFSGCSKRDLAQIAKLADEIDLPAGRVLTKEGEARARVLRAARRHGGGPAGDAVAACPGPGRLLRRDRPPRRQRADGHGDRDIGRAGARRHRAGLSRPPAQAARDPVQGARSGRLSASRRRSDQYSSRARRSWRSTARSTSRSSSSRVRDSRRLEQLRVDARRREAGDRVQLVDEHLAGVRDEAVDPGHALALGGDERAARRAPARARVCSSVIRGGTTGPSRPRRTWPSSRTTRSA